MGGKLLKGNNYYLLVLTGYLFPGIIRLSIFILFMFFIMPRMSAVAKPRVPPNMGNGSNAMDMDVEPGP